MTIGTKLRLLREKRKISQEELAHAVGVTQTTIGNWEHGKSIKLEYLSNLAKALDVPISYFFIENQNIIPLSSLERKNMDNGFEFIIKAPNHFFDDLNKKIDFLISRFDNFQ